MLGMYRNPVSAEDASPENMPFDEELATACGNFSSQGLELLEAGEIETEETTSQMSDSEFTRFQLEYYEAAKRFEGYDGTIYDFIAKEEKKKEESKQRAVKKLQKLNFP